jgi:hypothetical protein
MPISPPAERALQHTRNVNAYGYKRADGLWDIEAELIDVKSVPYSNLDRGAVAPGDFLHKMTVRFTIDTDFLIHAIEASIDNAPFTACPDVAAQFARLSGMRLGSDFLEVVEDLFGAHKGCTHLNELVPVVITTAYQTLWATREAGEAAKPDRKKPAVIDGCHALKSDGKVVSLHWPQFAKSKEPTP